METAIATRSAPESAPTPPLDEGERRRADRLRRLGGWMVALVVVRLAPWAWEWSLAVARWPRAHPEESLAHSDLPPLADLLPVVVLVWPLALGLALRRLRWPQLARAGGFTFFGLAAERLATLAMSLAMGVAVGSGPLVRWAEEGGATRLAVVATALAVPMALEFLVGGIALAEDRAWRRFGRGDDSDRAGRRRRGMIGRMAAAASLGVAALTAGLAAWEGYLSILTVYPSIRRLVLKADRAALPNRSAPRRPQSPLEREANQLFQHAVNEYGAGHFREARTAYFRTVRLLERVVEVEPDRFDLRDQLATVCNNLAWLLAICPEVELRDPARAVALAQRAVEADPGAGNSWNTLGVAYFRDGELAPALGALEESMRLRGGGDSFDWFFLAMIQSREGDAAGARRSFERAVDWMEDVRPRDRELRAFCAEAAAQLGIPAPEPRPFAETQARRRGHRVDVPVFGPGMNKRRLRRF